MLQQIVSNNKRKLFKPDKKFIRGNNKNVPCVKVFDRFKDEPNLPYRSN
jgi:hypothetical protein